MPRVLIISYYFPPAGGPGVQRVMSMVRYLPEYGWDPVVLTVKDGTFVNRDEGSLDDVPSTVPVYRTRSYEPHGWYNRLRGKPVGEALPLGHVGSDEPSWVSSLANVVRANVFVPDARIGWIPSATRAAVRIAKSERIDAILTSSPPQSVQIVGRRAARRSGLPWVGDYRDPWTKIYYNAELRRARFIRRLDERLEQACVRSADEVIAVNDMVRDSLGLSPERATVITNGYDADEFAGQVFPIEDSFTLVYVGNLISSLGPTATLFRVLGEMVRDPQFAGDLRLVFVGRIHERAREELRERGLAERTEFAGFVPHVDAIGWLRRATVPLFIGPGDILGTKVFEYIATGRPLLALAPPCGDVDSLLSSCGLDPAVDHGDAEGIRRRVAHLYDQWKSGSLPVRESGSGVEHLTRQRRTREVADVLNRALIRRTAESAGGRP